MAENTCVAAQAQEQARVTGNYLESMDSICLVDTATLVNCCRAVRLPHARSEAK